MSCHLVLFGCLLQVCCTFSRADEDAWRTTRPLDLVEPDDPSSPKRATRTTCKKRAKKMRNVSFKTHRDVPNVGLHMIPWTVVRHTLLNVRKYGCGSSRSEAKEPISKDESYKLNRDQSLDTNADVKHSRISRILLIP